MTKPVISFLTLGCKVNQYDSDAMRAILSESGFDVRDGLEPADIFVVNTCAVTAEAERKSRQAITRILKVNPEAEIYVCGCASQNNFSPFARDGVRFISGTKGKLTLARELALRYQGADDGYFDKIVTSDFETAKQYEDSREGLTVRTRHFVKVQDGCNNFCAYCIVPYLRGRSRSRSLNSVLKEIESAEVSSGEVVLTGINLSAYGKDIGTSLTDLVTALHSTTVRVRLGSLEVGVVDDKFLMATKGVGKFCPHFHLSLQSGDDGVLRDMNRKYTAEQFLLKVELIRRYYPDAGITTDIIVGYPTESEEAFANTVALARAAEFSDIHVFPYSSRKGTVAGRLPVLPPETVTERQRKMLGVKKELSTKYRLKQLGKSVEVLIESKEDGLWSGHTPNYVKVYTTEGERGLLVTLTPTAVFGDGVRV